MISTAKTPILEKEKEKDRNKEVVVVVVVVVVVRARKKEVERVAEIPGVETPIPRRIQTRERVVEQVKVVKVEKAVAKEGTTLEVAEKVVKGILHQMTIHQRTIHSNRPPNSPLCSWEMAVHPTDKRFKWTRTHQLRIFQP